VVPLRLGASIFPQRTGVLALPNTQVQLPVRLADKARSVDQGITPSERR
jgi:hypothetical protein